MNQGDEKKGESVRSEPFEPKSPDLEGRDTSMDPESMTREDWVESEARRGPLGASQGDHRDPGRPQRHAPAAQ